jgi:hypothetical protein
MNKRFLLLSLAPLLLIPAGLSLNCSSSPLQVNNIHSLSSIAWLIGNWENVSAKRILCEQWKQRDDSTFTGQSFFIRNSDTTYLESVIIRNRNGVISYNPTVPDQNEGKQIQFLFTSTSYRSFTAENPQHDFPQKITYMLKGEDSLHAHLEGIENGKNAVQDFYMKRTR